MNIERFKSKIKVNIEQECWEWIGQKMDKYPVFQMNDQKKLAHRVSYEHFIGPIPKNKIVRQTCENIFCVNPKHLKLDHSCKKIQPIEKRFTSKVKITSNCWEWIGGKTKDGYGSFRTAKGGQLAHRIAYQLFVDDLPSDYLVCHHCDNPSCVNPKHLFIGKDKDNSDDKVRKKRHHFGIRIHFSKLTPRIVKKIRKEYIETDMTQRELSKKYKIAHSAICNLLNHKTWKQVQ